MGVPSFVHRRLLPSAMVFRLKVVEGAQPQRAAGDYPRPPPRDNSAKCSSPQEGTSWRGAGEWRCPRPHASSGFGVGEGRTAYAPTAVHVGPPWFQPLLLPFSAPPSPAPSPGRRHPLERAPPRFKPQRREGCVSPRALTSRAAGDAARTGRPTSAATRG